MTGLFDEPRSYGVTVNGGISSELKQPRHGPPACDELAGYLDRLDGSLRFSVSLWEMPTNTFFDRVKLDAWPVHFLQAAGSRERMTVELRREGAEGDRHFVIGRANTIEAQPSQTISWDQSQTRVHHVEVFTAAEAVPLFLSYWQTGDIPAFYRLRALGL
jgi:hypothetical protein